MGCRKYRVVLSGLTYTSNKSDPLTKEVLQMGLQLSKIWDKFFGLDEAGVLMVGLDAAGKTTILYKIKRDEVVTTIPTIGFNVETITTDKIKFTVWDIGGQDRIRPLWRHYYNDTQAVIFVVDSNDRERIEEASDELLKMLAEPELHKAIVLVLGNKQDLPKAMSPEALSTALKLHSIKNEWYMQGACAVRGEGIHEGLDWLAEAIKKAQAKSNA